MSDDDAGQGRGRPQKFPGEGARISHSLRLKPAVADRLRVAAQAANRTLGEEMELRINASFDDEDALDKHINDAVIQRTYQVVTEANYIKLINAQQKHIYDWNLAVSQKYAKQLEFTYFNVRYKVMKRLKFLVTNRFAKVYGGDMETIEYQKENADTEIKILDEKIAFAEKGIEISKADLLKFEANHPEIVPKEYKRAIEEISRRVEKIWDKKE